MKQKIIIAASIGFAASILVYTILNEIFDTSITPSDSAEMKKVED